VTFFTNTNGLTLPNNSFLFRLHEKQLGENQSFMKLTVVPNVL